MKILFFGDIVGNHGINAVSDVLRTLVASYEPDLVIANGENATRGFGLNYADAKKIFDLGIDVVTLGNHWRNRPSIDGFLEEFETLLRPENVLNYDIGTGHITLDVRGVPVTISNLLGTAFMKETVGSPMVAMHDILSSSPDGIHIVDYHAESTSEKSTFAYYFDGQVSAVLGTHTHVQTADARLLPHGTAFISDVGMCGLHQSVIGFEPDSVIQHIVYGDPKPMLIPDEGESIVSAVLLDIDEETFLAKDIRPLYYVGGKERVYGEKDL